MREQTMRGIRVQQRLILVGLALVAFCGMAAAQNVTVNPGAGSYATLKAAFDAINAGTHTGSISVSIVGNTTETASAVLNASGSGSANYTAINITPSGARTISGAIAAGSPLLDLNGADNVTINGLNSSGNSLTISNTTASATTGTSTIRFVGGATSNLITNATILGSVSSSVATNGATIFFSTDSVSGNGNDNNTISNNTIGPAGSNLPSKAILGNGSQSSVAVGNSGVLIQNNNFVDYFAAAVTSAGIAINGGCNTWTISNNRFYQTAARTWTTGALHAAINLNSTNATFGVRGMTISGNTIGYASPTQTGTYALSGSTGRFAGIVFNGTTGAASSAIQNNTIAAISNTGSTASGTGSSSPMTAILISNGLVTISGNTIGSQAGTGSLSFATNTTTSTDVAAIHVLTADTVAVNSNVIGGLSFTNAGTAISALYGIRVNNGSSVLNATGNLIGGSVAGSLDLNANATGAQLAGFFHLGGTSTISSNTVRNLTSNTGSNAALTPAVVGIQMNTSTNSHIVLQNTIHSLRNTQSVSAVTVAGLSLANSSGSVVARNLIYNLQNDSTAAGADIQGIVTRTGTAQYFNNMIALGAGVGQALGGAASDAGTSGINGILDAQGTSTFLHNTVYIGGTASTGSGASYAFNSVQTTGSRTFRSNIFYNARANAGASGKHYAIKINGTAPNPPGLGINNNLYFVDGSSGVLGFFNGADVTSLGAWRTAVGQDASSQFAQPQLKDPTAASPDLHLSATVLSPAVSVGPDLGVTTDFDGDPRGTTLIDLGADEIEVGVLSLSANAITFADTLVGQTTPAQTITVSNTGTNVLTVDSLTAAMLPFALDPSSTCPPAPFMFGVADSCTLAYVFSPQTAGLATATLTLDAGIAGTASFTLSGATPTGNLVISPASVNFGDVSLGLVSADQTIELRNTGLADLHITALDTAMVPFNANGGTCGNAPLTLPPAGSCTLIYVFEPNALGPASQTFNVSTDGSGATNFNLLGNGVYGELEITPSTLAFGDVLVGQTSSVQFVTLSNIGTGLLRVVALGTPDAAFSAAAGGTCSAPPIALMPGQSCTLGYTFSPSAIGLVQSSVSTSTVATGSSGFNLSGTGIQGQLQISPSALNFGSIVLGQTSTSQTVTLSNTGSASLQVTALSTPTSAFVADGGGTCSALPITLAMGQSCTLSYAFAPTALGPTQATITVSANAPGASSFELSGTGIQGLLQISPTTLNFGSLPIASTSTPQVVTLSNTGTASLNITAVTAAASPFALDASSTCSALPITLAVGASCNLAYTFTPNTGGLATQVLSISADAPGSGDVTLSGTGLLGNLQISPTAISFGNVPVGQSSALRSVQLSNTGAASLNVTTLTPPTTPFVQVASSTCGTAPFAIAAGEFCTVIYRFAPSAAGPATQIITINADAPGSGSVTLTGIGTQGNLEISSLSHDFGSVRVGQNSAPHVVTLENTGASSLTVSSITAAATPFAQTLDSTCAEAPFELVAGDSCTLEFVFTPTNTGAANQDIEVTTSSPGSGMIALSGTGIEGQLQFNAMSLDFGDLRVGQTSSARTLTLSNTGSDALQITSVSAASGAFAAASGTCGSVPINLPVNSSCTLAWTFSPTLAGNVSQTLNISADAPGSGTVTLQGRGIQGLLQLSPSTLNLGSVVVGQSSAPVTVSLENTGTDALTISSITAALAPFALDGSGNCGSPPILIAAGGSCTLAYTYTPATTGPASQNLTLVADAPGASTLTLQGEGTQGLLEISPASLDFGNVRLGQTSSARLLALRNTGSSSLSVTGITAANLPFTLVAGGSCASLPIVLPANTQCTLAYQFAPQSLGPFAQTLSIQADSPGSGNVALAGVGVQGQLQISPTSLNFGSVIIGQSSAEQTVTLSNTGSADLSVTAISALAAPFARAPSSTCGTAPFTLSASASCTLVLSFVPASATTANQTLTVSADSPGAGTISLTGTGIQGSLQISPGNIAFGSVVVGQTSADQTVTLSNTGTDSLTIASLTAPTGAFLRTGGSCGSVPLTLAAGRNCTLLLAFAPTATGAVNQALTVTVSAPSSGSGTIQLSGAGIQGNLSITPSLLVFGNQVLGASSTPQSVTLSNTGNAALSVSLSGPSAPFSRSGGSCSASPINLAAGTSCTLSYVFAPSSLGPANGLVEITANGPGSGSVSLTGTGTQGVLSISPSSLTFAPLQVAQTAPEQSVTLSNTGTARLQITGVTAAIAPFERHASSTCPASLPFTLDPGQNCVLAYVFTPLAVGSFTQSLTVAADVPGANSINLQGQGIFIDVLFANSFEGSGLRAGKSASRVLPLSALADLLDAAPTLIEQIDDDAGEAVRLYARKLGSHLQVGGAVRGPDGRWQHLHWQTVQGDVRVLMTLAPMAQDASQSQIQAIQLKDQSAH